MGLLGWVALDPHLAPQLQPRARGLSAAGKICRGGGIRKENLLSLAVTIGER